MKRTRNRKRPTMSFQDRLMRFAAQARERASQLPPGRDRDQLAQRALENETAAKIDRWLSSPGLRSPK
jgi:threonine synthase